MQVFGNVGTDPIRKVSKTTQKGYYELRLSENRKNGGEATWYTVRLSKDANPGLSKGDFCKVTGTLRVDSFHDRNGKPASALLIIAFEAVKLKGADELKAVHEAKLAAAKEAVAA
jgi:single-stranded DNA-binding protein